MAVNIIADFFNIINVSLFDNAAVLLIACFIIWEIPRAVKIISEEYIRGLYPEQGRVADVLLLVVGIAAVLFLMNAAPDVVVFLKKPGITAFFLIIMVFVPLVVFFGFLKRFFERMGGDNSVTVFLTQGFLDLMHTVFYIAFSTLVIPTAGYLVLGS